MFSFLSRFPTSLHEVSPLLLLIILFVTGSTPRRILVDGREWSDLCDQLRGALGYPCEHVNITTADGFVLDVIHMRQVQANNKTSLYNYPVVLQHGLLDSAVTYFANAKPEQNLACLMYDQGYDIWLPNTRGNHYSLINTQVPQSSEEFWHRIDLDRIARYDLTAVIDGVLAHHRVAATNFTTLSWVGHSQGTTQMFMAMSQEDLRAQYAPKIDTFFALAPVTRLKYQTIWYLNLTDRQKLLSRFIFVFRIFTSYFSF